MRCFSCYKLSIKPICNRCKKDLLSPTMIEKEIGNLEVVSFFEYSNIEDFVKSKYEVGGYRVYKYLAKEYFQPFLKAYIDSLNSNKKLYLIGIDENVARGYSNISLLLHYGSKKSKIKPLYSKLKAKNSVKYAGRSLEFRLENPREFIYRGLADIDAILIDDVVTTGTTLEEAHRVLKKSNVNIHFALTLANAQEGVDY